MADKIIELVAGQAYVNGIPVTDAEEKELLADGYTYEGGRTEL